MSRLAPASVGLCAVTGRALETPGSCPQLLFKVSVISPVRAGRGRDAPEQPKPPQGPSKAELCVGRAGGNIRGTVFRSAAQWVQVSVQVLGLPVAGVGVGGMCRGKMRPETQPQHPMGAE